MTVVAARSSDAATVVSVVESPRLRPGVDRVSRMRSQHMSVPLAVGLVLAITVGIGLLHGVLITKLGLQPFVVTLCGLLFYRGYARYLTNEQSQGFAYGFDALKYLASGRPVSVPVPFLTWISEGNWSRYQWDYSAGRHFMGSDGERVPLDVWASVAIPMPVIILAATAVAAAVLLNWTVLGRYLLALGRNEQAARFSGIRTDRLVITAYVICAVLAGVAGILFALDLNSIQPASHGNFFELYAIAAAVLGGCSLRGGEGSILGVLIGTAVMQVLSNSIIKLRISTHLEFAIIGMVLLAGVVADEMVKRYAARRRARQEAAQAAR
jgi:ribose transport system permease protein